MFRTQRLIVQRKLRPRCFCAAPSSFELSTTFVERYANKQPPFGFNGLGELVYMRTYSRTKPDFQKERWYETVERVVNGTYCLQKEWMTKTGMPWNEAERQVEAQDMFDRMFTMKFLPPGRGLWAMGTTLTRERRLFAALNNCAFVSTDNLVENPSGPFCFLMDASMLGVGVGFDTLGAGSLTVRQLRPPSKTTSRITVPDSREGWVDSLKILLEAFLHPSSEVNEVPSFDYSAIRPAGVPIKGFGGTSQGPEILENMHNSITEILSKATGQALSVTVIVDIMNLIGKCVVSGNVRRTAEIAFGDPTLEEYVSLKDYTVNPHRQAYGWTSNNSVFAKLGMDYNNICQKIISNGEPGFAWLENMQNYGRMCSPPDYADHRARGGNPCLEQTLESYEMCCLVETFPHRHTSQEDFMKTLRVAMTYAKSVTLGPTHWPQSNAIMLRNRRIGTSLSGVAQFIATRGVHELKQWCEAGYATVKEQDGVLSERFGVPMSIKTTCIKPSGTVSLLAGSTPGMHYPESRFYIRRMRISNISELLDPIRKAGYKVEPAVGSEDSSVVVEIPVDAGDGVRTLDEVSMWEQLGLASFLQRYWADNQVSCTVTFDPKTEGPQMADALNIYQYQLKGVSFLPRERSAGGDRDGSTPYPQMPYEAISEEQYLSAMENIRPLDLQSPALNLTSATGAAHDHGVIVDEVPDKFCDSAGCSIDNEVDR